MLGLYTISRNQALKIIGRIDYFRVVIKRRFSLPRPHYAVDLFILWAKRKGKNASSEVAGGRNQQRGTRFSEGGFRYLSLSFSPSPPPRDRLSLASRQKSTDHRTEHDNLTAKRKEDSPLFTCHLNFH